MGFFLSGFNSDSSFEVFDFNWRERECSTHFCEKKNCLLAWVGVVG